MDRKQYLFISNFDYMILYLKKIIVFVSFFILLYSVPFYILWKSGELKDLEEVVELTLQNQNDSLLVGWGYNDYDRVYKLKMVSRIQPDVLALGSSRILQISSDWFLPNFIFYNAGCGAYTPDDAMLFLQLSHAKPKILIYNIDQWTYNPNFIEYQKGYEYNYNPLESVNTNLYSIWQSLFEGKFDFSKLLSSKNIGINAIINEMGYRHYGNLYKNPKISDDYGFKDTFNRIETGDRRFQYGDEINEESVSKFQQLVEYCRHQKIYLISFLPPFAPIICEKLESYNDKYEYMHKLPYIFQQLVDNETSFFFNFQNPNDYGAQNNEFIDGFHGGPKTYLRLVNEIADSLSFFKDYLKPDSILNDYFDGYVPVNIYK